MELGYDGNAATAVPAEVPAPAAKPPEPASGQKPKRLKSRRQELLKSAKSVAKTVPSAAFAPKAVISILVVAVVVMMMLVSHAQLVMVNDQAVSLRSELTQLQDEGTKLKVKYELTYDLQEIETRMLTSGQMIKIQNWQTFVLELSEPDQVEYYQNNGLLERIGDTAKNLASVLKEYF